jgi:D-glucosaminate-6-phosphate ammonia-lyase
METITAHRDIYAELGVKKIINGVATLTSKGGSIMPPAVLEAMVSAAQHFVDIDELQEKAGQKIAEWTHNEAAYVSCGCAAGMVLATAACITGLDEEKRARLPYSDGLKNEIIVHRSGLVGYAFAIRQAGGKLIEIGTENSATLEDLENAVSDRTAAIFVFYRNLGMNGQIPLEIQIDFAKKHNIPLIVDAAAQLPPVENLWRFTHMGVDMALFSGGKGLCGPQSSGLMVGRRDLIQASAFNACPRGFIGRPMKVGKEEIVGLMAAVKWYLDLDHEKLTQEYEDQVAMIIQSFSGYPGVRATRSFPSEAGQPHGRAELVFDEATIGMNRDQILPRLLDDEPAVFLSAWGENGVLINPQTLQPGEAEIIVRQIKKILSQ